MKKPKPPILPRSKKDPSGTDSLELQARRDFNRRFKKVRQVYLDLLDNIPSFAAEAKVSVNKRYIFRLDGSYLTMLLQDASSLIDSILLEGGVEDLWFFRSYVGTAYTRGVMQEIANLSRQSPTYAAEQEAARTTLYTEPFQRRMRLLATREYEEMRGLSAVASSNMARILTEGIALGKSPREIARDLSSRASIESKRAHLIARTEIPTALRRARMDEADDATDELGLRSMQMHQSALSPTTRPHHAARHGNLYTTEQQRDWWSRDANSINCKCSTVTVLVDRDNKPLVPEIQKRARETKAKMMESRDDD